MCLIICMTVKALCMVLGTITAILVPTLFVFRFIIGFGFAELLFILFFIHILLSPLCYFEMKSGFGQNFPIARKSENSTLNT